MRVLRPKDLACPIGLASHRQGWGRKEMYAINRIVFSIILDIFRMSNCIITVGQCIIQTQHGDSLIPAAMGREGEMDQPEQSDRETEMLRERLNRLSQASLRINESLDFDQVLQGVLDSACSLTSARYGVMTLSSGTRRTRCAFSSATSSTWPASRRAACRWPRSPRTSACYWMRPASGFRAATPSTPCTWNWPRTCRWFWPTGGASSRCWATCCPTPPGSLPRGRLL